MNPGSCTIRLQPLVTPSELKGLAELLTTQEEMCWEVVADVDQADIEALRAGTPLLRVVIRIRAAAGWQQRMRLRIFLHNNEAIESVVTEAGETIAARAVKTEESWLSGDDAAALLERAQLPNRGRKHRLFGCACCRKAWSLLTDERCRRAVEVAEQFADGLVGTEQLAEAHAGAEAVRSNLYGQAPESAALSVACAVLSLSHSLDGCKGTANQLVSAAEGQSAKMAVRAAHADLVRDLVANPFRPAPILDPAWLVWNDGTVKRLAEQAYQERLLPSGQLDPQRLAVMADALEEAGCTNQDILLHLRQQGAVHVRGCFAVDWILGLS